MDSYEFDETQKKFIENSVIPYAVYLYVDRRVVTLAVSAGLCELLGMTRTEAVDLMNNDMYKGTHPDDIARVADLGYQFAVGGEVYDAVYRTKSRTGKYVTIHAHGRKVRAKDGTPLAFIWYMSEPLNARKKIEAEKQLAATLGNIMRDENMFHKNYYDALTGLPNMSHFLSLAQEAGEKAQENGNVSKMLFFDLCGMKSFNGKYGYSEGDRLIRTVGAILKNHFGSENCGRIGQDHFMAYSVSENLDDELNAVFKEVEEANDGKTLPLRTGIYVDKYDKIDVGMAFDRAKIACDTEKSSHFSKFTYYDLKMRTETILRDYILNNLEKALSEHWIKVFYQPILRAKNSHVTEEEALCRWIDPDRGVISPGDFISILEEAKLIHKVDLYMVDRILEDFETKKKEGIRPVPVSINLSRVDFFMCDIVQEICKRMDKARMDRSMISIEITESFAEADAEFLKIQIDRFHRAGFKVWMDDFGSGYSSLNSLDEFDFDLVKFDMIFLRSFEKSGKSRIILENLLRMTKDLGLETIVEDVETEEQMQFLKDAGADKLQGYFFDRPAPLPNVIERIKTGMCFSADLPDGTTKIPEKVNESLKKAAK